MCIKNNENLSLNIAASLGNYKCACLIFFYYQPFFNVENLNTVIMTILQCYFYAIVTTICNLFQVIFVAKLY